MLLLIFSILVGASSHAMFMGYEVKQIPIERLEANLKKKAETAKRPDEKIRYQVNLGRLYGMAYHSGSATGPVKDFRGQVNHEEEPSFDDWLKNPRDLENAGIDFPQDPAKKPLKADQKAYLEKAIKQFQEVLTQKEDFTARLGLGWALLEAGRKQEAKVALARLFAESGNIQSKIALNNFMDALPPSMIAGFHISPEAKRLVVKMNDTEVLNKPFIPFAIAERSRRASGLALNAEADIYEANPSRENLEKLIAKILAAVPTNAEMRFNGDILSGYMRDAVLADFRGAHNAMEGKPGFSQQLRLALTTGSPDECRKLEGLTSIVFAEGDFPLDLLCATRIAWEKKDWGICREYLKDNVMPKQKLPACIGYLAHRSGKAELCKEVRDFLKESSFSHLSGCEKFAQRKNDAPKRSGPKFYSLDDWREGDLKEAKGWISVSLKFKEGKIEVESTDISFPSGFHFNQDHERQGKKRELDVVSFMRNPGKLTVPISVAVKNGRSQIVEEETGSVPAPITEKSLGQVPADFKIESALRKISIAEAGVYYLRTLDPQKDKPEMEKVKKEVWQSLTLHNSMSHPITPLAVGLRPGLAGKDMLQTGGGVSFDLMATRQPQLWSWINPAAAWLVYRSPTEERPIDGTHLFGENSFWLFWDHGFQPLCALDNDGDSILRGEELSNIYFWRDRNSNGREEAGEVTSLAANSVAEIDCRHKLGKDGLRQNPKGIRLKNGEALPIVDLILQQR